MPTVARVIVDTLHASGVERVYGISGDSLNGFTDALREANTVEWFGVRHEEAAAFAASAEAALTNQLAVCAGSCGPGNLHLINGLYDAQRSRVPVLAIAAHIPSQEIGSGYFQETHPQELFRECSVFAEHVSTPDQMPRLLRIAMREAIAKQGVAVLVVPGDIGLAEISAEAEAITAAHPRVLPTADTLAAAAQALNEAKKVTILAGAGVAGAHQQVLDTAEALQAPVLHGMRGKEHIGYDNPYDVGMTGLLGHASGYHAMMDCDTLLILGSDLPYQQFYPQHATVIQVDIREEQIGRRTAVDIAVVGSMIDTLEELLPRLEKKTSSAHLDSATQHFAKTQKSLQKLATASTRTIHPQYLAKLINDYAADDAVFIPDVGSPVVWAARYLEMTPQRRLIGSFWHGSMANALPQAIGAQASFPDRQVIALAGDGGLAMIMGELLSAVQHQLPLKIVVFNNSSLNFVEVEMKAAGVVNFGTELHNPSFAAIADAAGLRGFRVEKSQDLEHTVQDFLAVDGPALLDVVTERQELSIPPTITAEQAKGFTLYALRTVLDGHGSELLDLAKANIRQLF